MKVGLALGSGSARGFSHIGIIDCLLDQGLFRMSSPELLSVRSSGPASSQVIWIDCANRRLPLIV